MEMIGKVFKLKNADSVSVHHTTQYRKLRQDVTDDERDDEDDDVVFLRKGIELKQQNGFDVDHVKLGSDSDIDLKSSRKMRALDSCKVKQGAQKKRAMRKRPIFLLLILITAMVTASALAVLAMQRHKKIRMSRSWTQEFVDFEGSSNIALYDVGEDGTSDVIVGLMAASNYESSARYSSRINDPCKSKEHGGSCSGRLVRMKGEDGEILWETTTPFGVGDIKCGAIDIDRDGSMDCVASGLYNGLLAFSPKTGHLIWSSNSSLLNRDWSMVGMETLADVNDDGIIDLVVLQSKPDDSQNDTDHHSMLLLVDGRTGTVLGQPIRIKEESKFPPMVHKFKDQTLYVVYGTGSSLTRGSLFVMSARDFHSAIMSSPEKPHVTDSSTFKVSRNHFAGFENDGGVINILSNHHGIIIPPLFLDADSDGEEDMVIASCDGNITLFGGTGNRIVWSLSFSEHHVTRPMVHGYLNEDVYPDILVYLNIKPDSNITSPSSVVAILSGATGTIIWTLNDTAVEFHAPNVRTSTADDGRDFLMFWLKRQTSSDVVKKRNKRHARNSKLPTRTKLNPRSRGRSPSYGDYITYNRRPQFFDGGNAYSQGDGDYRSEYGPGPDQPLPSRNRPYPPEYYNQPDDDINNDYKQDMTLRNHFKGANRVSVSTSTRVTPTISSTHSPTIQSECRSLVEQSFLIGLDRYSTIDPFVILKDDAIPPYEMDGISEEFLNLSSLALKSNRQPSQFGCPHSLIQSTTSVLGDVDNDEKVELISATTFASFDRQSSDRHPLKLFRVSKLDIQLQLSEIINKRLESLTLSPPRPSNSPLEASRTMTQSDLSHYSGFELRQSAPVEDVNSDQ